MNKRTRGSPNEQSGAKRSKSDEKVPQPFRANCKNEEDLSGNSLDDFRPENVILFIDAVDSSGENGWCLTPAEIDLLKVREFQGVKYLQAPYTRQWYDQSIRNAIAEGWNTILLTDKRPIEYDGYTDFVYSGRPIHRRTFLERTVGGMLAEQHIQNNEAEPGDKSDYVPRPAVQPAMEESDNELEEADEELSEIEIYRAEQSDALTRYIEALPDDTKVLDVSNKDINRLPSLIRFNSLKLLICSNNYLQQLPQLPDSLGFLNCANNPIMNLPEILPPHLKTLICGSCMLNALPILPDTLKYLDCSSNNLRQLPVIIPSELQTLLCNNNNLTSFPFGILRRPQIKECLFYGNLLYDVGNIEEQIGENHPKLEYYKRQLQSQHSQMEL